MPKNHEPDGGAQPPRRTVLFVVAALVCMSLAAASVVVGVVAGTPREADAAATSPSPLAFPPTRRPVPTAVPASTPVPTFNRAARDRDDPASLWVVVNKQRPLQPADHTPDDLVTVPVAHTWQPQLRQEASVAVIALFAAARDEAGLSLASNSAYRGFAAQTRVCSAAVSARGVASADQGIARPGSSEHQTGLAIDIGAESGRCSLNACFAETTEGQWLAQNAARFGFLLRYPADKVAITGYEFEPWHFRYIGPELAAEMRVKSTTTLEEFFGLPAAPRYP
ncbi:M15 family metallopeptidase [Cryobacterium sp. CG_9.6]|uniref:M15 family metallopeptidase n=1 Tax=Cryobacterium sp. CG_9.6 TaxID=2760710 RepID=UPI0024745D7D|nr:M15 family metallopeptidase [Cryobacterium sp. CG_9.6]MDH6235582.1 D-alanyl-D-alanine carboxypeptidase [Cryobacterium sp. CG_9.6]